MKGERGADSVNITNGTRWPVRSRRRAFKALALYIAYVPAFALAYAIFTPDGFATTAAGAEPSVRATRALVDGVFQEEFRSARPSDRVLLGDGWELDHVEVSSCDAGRRTNAIECTISGIGLRGQYPGSGYEPAAAAFDIDVAVRSLELEVPTWEVDQLSVSVRRTSGTADIPGHADEPEVTLGAIFIAQHVGELGEQLRLEPTASQDAAIRRYAAILQGIAPPGSSFGLGRLLYVSGVTLTTVGYGDFVPVTGTARTLALVEAFLGVVTLSAVFYLLGTESRSSAQNPSKREVGTMGDRPD